MTIAIVLAGLGRVALIGKLETRGADAGSANPLERFNRELGRRTGPLAGWDVVAGRFRGAPTRGVSRTVNAPYYGCAASRWTGPLVRMITNARLVRLLGAVLGLAAVVALGVAAAEAAGGPPRTASAAAAAKPAALKGNLAGARLPAAGKGVAGVRAVSLASGAVVAAGYTGAGGRWRLTPPAGGYALIASVISFRKAPTIDLLVALARGRAGRTSTLRLSLKPIHRKGRQRARGRAAVQEGFGGVSVSYPAIWIHHFGVQSQDPALGVLGKGIADMLTTELSGLSSRFPDCRAIVVEREHIGDVLNEQKLSQLPGFDPSTRIRMGQIVRDNSSVTGTVTQAGGQMTLTATYTNRQTGSHGTVSVTGSAQRFHELEQQLGAKLAELICQPQPPYYYKVLAASETDHTEATMTSGTGLCDQVGGTSGSNDFGGTLAAAQYSADNKLDKDFGGILTGRIYAKVPEATTNHTLHGCKFGDNGITPCSTVLPADPPVPGSVGFSLSADAPGASTVKLTGSVVYPSVGAVTGGDPNATCFVNISGSNIPTQELQQDVPVSRFAGTVPFTITFAGQHTWNSDLLGHPATITKSWHYSLTIQRVDANGNRL